MNAKKRQHFRKLLMSELRLHAEHITDEQAQALDVNNDDAKENSDVRCAMSFKSWH